MIKKALKKYGLTQQDLAQRLNINRVSVSRLLSDNNDMRISTLKKIADAIGCSAAELITDEAAAHTDTPNFTCPKCGCKLNILITEKDKGQE